MKLTTFLLLFAVIQTMGLESYSQVKKLSLNFKNTSLKEVLSSIEDKTEYYFLYSSKIINVDRKIDVDINGKSISEALAQILKDTDIDYVFRDRQILLSSKSDQNKLSENTQQQKSVSGRVTDNSGGGLPGVTVLVKGTTTGVITDMDGKYTLSQVPENAILQFSFVGMKTQEIKVDSKTTINVTLTEETLAIDEVVAIGYGTQRKKDLTGAVAGVTSKALESVSLIRAQDALQGRMSGVDVQKLNGEVGTGMRIRIRGSSSINKTNDPLYVVDGVVRSMDANNVVGGTSLSVSTDVINPDDIASIDILKDASATAVYGSRGANGVVIITTKRGKSGQNSITFSSKVGVQTTPKRYDVLGAYDYAMALNLYAPGTISQADVDAYKNGTKQGINWQDLQYQTGINQDYNIGITGGNDKTQYFISGNTIKQKGIKRFSEYKLSGAHANITTNVTNWFKIDADMSLSQSKAHNTGNNGQFNDFLNQSPTMEMINPVTGYYNIDYYNSIYTNPYGAIKENSYDNLINKAGSMINLTFNLAPGLTFSNIFGTDYTDIKNYTFESKKVLLTVNNVQNNDAYYFGWQNTMNLTYNRKWGDHSLTATGVYELTYNQSRFMNITGRDLLSESFTYWNEKIAQTRDADNRYSENGLESWFGRFNYDYKSRYSLTTTLRADGSSKFSKSNRWGFFPSAAIAWNIINENFMKGQNIFQQLKIRFSAGIAGSQAIGDFDVLGSLDPRGSSYGGTSQSPGYWNRYFPTPDLKWEKTFQYDAGIDFSVLDNRLNFTADWYLKRTTDALMQKNVPLFNGGGSIWVNQGVVNNSGVEFSVNGVIMQKKDFFWRSSINATYMKNTVKDLGGQDSYFPIPGGGVYDTPPLIVKVGHPIGSFYGYTWKGLDANGNNIFSDTQDIIGKSNPDVVLGFENTLTYKNWQFNALISGSFGAQRMNITRFMMSSLHGDSRFITLSDAYFKSFDYLASNGGNKANAEFPTWKGTNKNHAASTQWVEDADYIRIKSLGLIYNLNKNVTKYADIRISFNIENLHTFTKYKGLDPEVGVARPITSNGVINSNTESAYGFDMYQIPLPTTYTMGLQFTF